MIDAKISQTEDCVNPCLPKLLGPHHDFPGKARGIPVRQMPQQATPASHIKGKLPSKIPQNAPDFVCFDTFVMAMSLPPNCAWISWGWSRYRLEQLRHLRHYASLETRPKSRRSA